MGDFCEQCADYMNTLLRYSEKNKCFTCYNFNQAEKELKEKIEPYWYTDELRKLLIATSSHMLIHGVDPTVEPVMFEPQFTK